MPFDINMIEAWYAALPQRIADARKVLGRPLNLTEKYFMPIFIMLHLCKVRSFYRIAGWNPMH